MAPRCWLLLMFCYFWTISSSNAFIEGLYCHTENCYDVLGVTRESSRSELTKAYRKLARKWHPDMHRKKDDKEAAGEMFQKIANAYEILKDDEQRKDYDYMLDNPDEHYRHYYYYYRRRMAPQVDVRIVVLVTISIISAFQYYGQWSNYNEAIKYLLSQPKYRMKANDIAKRTGLIGPKDKKRKRYKTKDELRAEEEEILKTILVEKMDIKGGYSKPDVYNILWFWIIFSPYYLVMYIYWYGKWIYQFNIKREEYGEEEKLYLIKKFMKASGTAWEVIEDDQKEEYIEIELWKYENFKVWKEKEDEEMKSMLAENGRHKSYRRWMKNNGPGQISFGPE